MNQPFFFFLFLQTVSCHAAHMSAYNPSQHEEEENIFHHHIWGGGIRNITCKRKRGLKRMKQVKDFSFTGKWKVLCISSTVRGTDQSRLRLSIFLASL